MKYTVCMSVSTWLDLQLSLCPQFYIVLTLSEKLRLQVSTFSKLLPGDGTLVEKDKIEALSIIGLTYPFPRLGEAGPRGWLGTVRGERTGSP